MEVTATASTTTTTTAKTSTDPVSSLRAAALSTLKSKRRKPQATRQVPISARPPPPSDTLQLDYGAEDTSQDVAMNEVAALTASPASPPTQLPAREEGEISEEEDSLPSPKPPSRQRSTPRMVSSPKRSASDFSHLSEPSQTHQRPLVQTSKDGPPDSQSLVPTVKVLDSSPAASSPLSSATDNQMQDVVISVTPQSVFAIGPDCVRPGLYLNQEQYDTTKDIILDLLGWGVPPTYFIDCGVSREAIYYVFSELNLAFPEGFDVSGLVPYVPELLPGSPLMPPPPLPENRGGPTDVSSHHDSPSAVLSKIKTSPGVSQPLDSSPTVDLHDIERQRRQELLARKAVQASRKLRQSTSTDSSNGIFASPVARVEEPPTATAVAVDDFLNSIGSVPNLGNKTRSPSGSSEPQPVSNNMDVQEDNLNGTSSPLDGCTSPPPLSADTSATNETHSSTSGGAPPTSGSSSSFSQMSESDSGTVSHLRIESPSLPSSVPPRRTAKRPVATDFDFDAVPRRNGSLHQPLPKQPRTAFGSIASRRCVIDLSDSDGEDEPIRFPRQSGVELSAHTGERRGKPASFVSPASTKPPTPGTPLSPSILLQKELEIRKMRELIAHREEETRLKKLAAKAATNSSGATTPNKDVVVPIAQPQPRFKVEEIDIVMSSSEPAEAAELMARRSSESASPPGEISEASLPVTRSITKSPTTKNSTQYPRNSVAPQEHETLVKVEPLSHSRQHSMFSMVDVDMPPLSSAQMNKSPMITSALLKQDARKPSPLETSQEHPDSDDPETETSFYFTNYQSLFDSYPLLRTSPDIYSSLRMHTSIQPSMSPNFLPSTRTAPTSSPSFIPDLKPLRLAALSKRLDPSKRLCQYEIPGGGTCRDNQCEDMHLSRLEGIDSLGEPSDLEAAHFLFSVMPDDWLATFQVQSPSRIHEALEQVGHQTANSSLSLEDKVTNAMALIGSSSIPT